MASLSPFSVQDAMDMIYVAVDNDPASSTDTTQDEWTARLRLINMCIGAWESQDVIWRELWTTYTHGSPISAANQTYTIAATDYRGYDGSFLMFTDPTSGNILTIDVIRQSQVQPATLQGARKAYITGNARTGFVINFTFTLVTGDQLIGRTMSLYYYKSATKMTLPTDLIEMSDPQYIVNWVAGKKNLFNGRTDIASDYLDSADLCMQNMRIRNEFTEPFADNRMPDVDAVRDGDSFGL